MQDRVQPRRGLLVLDANYFTSGVHAYVNTHALSLSEPRSRFGVKRLLELE